MRELRPGVNKRTATSAEASPLSTRRPRTNNALQTSDLSYNPVWPRFGRSCGEPGIPFVMIKSVTCGFHRLKVHDQEQVQLCCESHHREHQLRL